MQPQRRTAGADVERLIDAVLHDVRTPLAAATGYLRLIREGRVAPGEQVTHVLEQAQASLRSIAVLCANADVCRRTDDGAKRMSVPAARMVDALVGAVAAHDVVPETDTWPATTTVEVCGDWSELCHQLGHALGVLARPRKNDAAGTVSIRNEGGVFTVSAALPARYASVPLSAFDPWAYPGLTVAAGLHVLELAGGRWTFDNQSRALRAELETADLGSLQLPVSDGRDTR